MQGTRRFLPAKSLSALAAAAALVAVALVGAAVPAAAAGNGIATLPTISDDQWFIGSTKAVTVGWTNTVDTITSAMVRSPWPWGSAWSVDTTGVPAGGDTVDSSGSATVTCSQSSTLIATFTFTGVTLTGHPTCKFQKSAYWHGFWVEGNMTVAANSTVSVAIPSGQITAPTTAQTDTWLVGKYDASSVGSPLALISSTSYVNPPPPADGTFAPQPPKDVTVTKVYEAALDADVLKVSWTTPTDQGTLPVTHYSVYGGPDWGNPSHPSKVASCATGAGLWTNEGNTDLNSCVVRSRNGGYGPQLGANVFFVKAFNGLGWSGAAESNMLEVAYDPTPASAPLDLVAVGGWNKVTVSFKKPASKGGGGKISNYLVISDPGRKACITTVFTYDPNRSADADPLTCVFTDLKPGTKYQFYSQALNGNGWGALSAGSNRATPQNMRITGYDRRKLGLFSLFKSEVTIQGATPGFPAGTVVTPWVAVGNGAWAAKSSFKSAASEKFTWSQRFDRKDDGKVIKVKFAIGTNESNSVEIPKVK